MSAIDKYLIYNNYILDSKPQLGIGTTNGTLKSFVFQYIRQGWVNLYSLDHIPWLGISRSELDSKGMPCRLPRGKC